MLESELEPEFVSLLEVLRRPDPAVVPGSQQERSLEVPAKLVTGAYLNRLKLSMVQFSCHLEFAPTLGALFCRYEGEDLAEKLLVALEHWHTLGLDLKVMQGMVHVFYAELRRKRGSPLPATAGQ
ncbi:MAG: hypothetical protein NTX53_03040 [candidate division WOR-3 bacterium]|nr:hypothetical protein [candidate division WOR-3 bacterium]